MYSVTSKYNTENIVCQQKYIEKRYEPIEKQNIVAIWSAIEYTRER
jgi:hypothetical protein